VAIDLRSDDTAASLLATLPDIPSTIDSVTHIVCSPRVCGVQSDLRSSIRLRDGTQSPPRMIDGGSNVCVTGDLSSLLDVTDIHPITISIALEGDPASYDDCITKRGLLPLTLTDGTTYYQTCFYCANMVETIISPAAVLESSDVFYSWINGVDVVQTRDYLKIDCHTYIEKMCAKYLASWLNKIPLSENRPTPLPSDSDWLKGFNAATGPTDPKAQADLATNEQLRYRTGVGELIWAMTTCRPDIAFTSVKLSQSNSTPAEIHYHGLKHAIRYLYITRNDGIYFWRTSPRLDLPERPLPIISSHPQDLLLEGRPAHDATIAVAYGDSDWATCVKTRRSFSGICIQLAGGTIAYKTRFQPTVAMSSIEAEFMAACDVGRMSLFVRSILWDLDIPHRKPPQSPTKTMTGAPPDVLFSWLTYFST
jgi:hypothetical protein